MPASARRVTETPASPRRVAVLGGSRIPFARQNGPYARASNQDMLTATLNSLAAKFDLEGEVLGEVAAGAVLKHSRDFNLTRKPCSVRRSPPRRPLTTCNRPAAPGSRRRSSWPTRSRSGRLTPASPAG